MILKYDATELVAGGAGNAANNVAALGGPATLAGIVGADAEGRRLLAGFRAAWIAVRSCARSDYRTPVKTRILAGGIHSAKQQVVRIDREAGWPLGEARRAATFARKLGAVAGGLRRGAAVRLRIGSRHAGAGRRRLRRRSARRGRRRPIPMLVDTRYRAARLPRADGLHAQRVRSRAGPRHPHRRRPGRARGAPAERCSAHRACAPCSSRGAAAGWRLFEPKQPTIHVPIFGSDEVADVTGAGDTVIATMALALAAGASFYEATRLANYAGGLVVMKRGTATVSARELSDAIESDHDTSPEAWSQEGPEQGRGTSPNR